MDIDDPRPIIKTKPFANEDANLINCFGMEGFWSEIERERSTACGRGRSSTRWDPRRIFKVKGKGGRRLTMFTCTKHKFPTKNKAAVRLLAEVKVWDLFPQSSSAPAGTNHLTAEFVSTLLCSRSGTRAVGEALTLRGSDWPPLMKCLTGGCKASWIN